MSTTPEKPKTRKAAKRAVSKQEGSVKCCTLEQAAAIDFEPWQNDPAYKLPTLEEIGNPHLIRCRLAYGIMHKTKPDLANLFSGGAESRTIVLRLIEVGGDLEESRKFFEAMATLIEGARLRLIVAGACYTEAA
jgi:hypothetical protein